MDPEFASDAAMWFRLEVSGDRESESLVKAVVSDGSGRRRTASVADGLAPGFSLHGFPRRTCSNVLPEWQRASSQARDPAECGRETWVYSTQGWTVACRHLGSLANASQPYPARQGMLQGHGHQAIGSPRASLEAGCHTVLGPHGKELQPIFRSLL